MAMRGTRASLAVLTAAVTLSGCAIGQHATAQTVPPRTVTVTAGAGTPAPSAPAPVVSEGTPSATPSTEVVPSTSSPPPSLQQAYADTRSGVVRLQVTTCQGTSVGSGFQIAPDLVVTAAHVVAGATIVRAVEGTMSTAADVEGVDFAKDIALVRTTTPLPGTVFQFSGAPAKVGEQVAALGFPDGDALTFHTGVVNALNRRLVVGGDVVLRHGLIETDVSVQHGNSGGPLIDAAGEVVGVIDAFEGLGNNPSDSTLDPQTIQGRRLAVSADVVAPAVQYWAGSPQPTPAQPSCPTAVTPDGELLPQPFQSTPAARGAIDTLNVYFRAVNFADYPTALAQMRDGGSVKHFTKALASTSDSGVSYRGIREEGGAVTVWTEFTSHQDPGNGPQGRSDETCTEWSLDYGLVPVNGLWLIDKAAAHRAGMPSRPCD